MKFGRLLIIFLSMLVIAFIVHLWIYKTFFSYESISNVLFGVGIILFLPSFIAMTHAYRVFNGINYTMRSIMSNSFKAMYPKFSDFKKDKEAEIKTSLFIEMLISASILLIAGIIYAGVAMS